jgi:hypothetical protein
VAVVQRGASSTTELAALGRPFISAPIEGHIEQEIVAGRPARYGAGRRLSLRSTPAGELAHMIREELEVGAFGPSLPVNGAEKAARHIAAPLTASRARRGTAGFAR